MGSGSVLHILAVLCCRCLRAAEFILPFTFLHLLLWPAAAFWAAWELFHGKPTVRQFDRLPASLRPRLSRPAWIWRLWRERTRLNLTKLLCLWPDRLDKTRWKNRRRCVGLERFEELRTQGRPVILAVLHFGPLVVLRYWLRARGIAVASLLQRSAERRPLYRRYLDRISDRAGGLSGVPNVFDLHRLREVYRFLQPGNVLLQTVEGRRGRYLLLRTNDFEIAMTTGMLRLAASTGAIIVPCLITAEPRMGFTVHFGRAIAPELVMDKARHRAACGQLLGEFLPVLQGLPEQCSYELLWAFRPTVTNPTPVLPCLTGTMT